MPAIPMTTSQTILLVTRDGLRIDLLRPALLASGFVVLIARDGQQAITCVREQLPDLLVIERRLPDIDGFDLCRLLRARTPVPIMLIADNAPPADLVDALNHGVDDVLNGAFSSRELVARVRTILRRTAPHNLHTAS